jgi:ATP-dependent DNA helicase RecG
MGTLPKKESQNVEFKTSFNEDVIETLVAFANTNGGKVLIGVANNGLPIKNFTIGDESIQQWLNEIKNKTQPSIIPDAGVVRYKGGKAVEFSVQEFPVKPVAFRGRYFKRVKNSNHQLSPIEISDMSMQTLQVSWDSYPAHGISMKDIDLDKVRDFIRKVNEKGRFHLSGTSEDGLRKLKLLRDGKISNAAALLFAKEDTIYNVHLGRFKTPSMIIDDRMLRLPLFEAVEETMKYIVSHIKFAFEIRGYPTSRTEIPEYPLDALRELVLNAVIHRDYMSPADIQIKIFDNRISFFNPGTLHSNINIEDLKTDSYSAYARNKLIAEAFYLTGDIEKYGSGFLRIRDAISAYPTMKIDFKEACGGFMATIFYTEQKMAKYATEGICEVAERAIINLDGVTEKVTVNADEVTEKVTVNADGVTENQQVILRNMVDNPAISAENLSIILGISLRKTKENISKLKAKNMIERVGPDKGGYWSVKNESF